MRNLPWDNILDILVRLPLKSIALLRCVNHSWNNELKSSNFLIAHCRFASGMGKFNLMVQDRIDIDTFSFDPSLFTFSRITNPIKSLGFRIEVLGCCHGLFLLRLVINKPEFNKYTLTLWNPTTNECKRIPNPPSGTYTEDDYMEYETYALGYSARTEDFKVVHLAEALQEGLLEVQVYASNSWRRLANIEIYILYWYDEGILSNAVQVPVDGSAHWFASAGVVAGKKDMLVLHFEFETEEFDKVTLPDFSEGLEPSLCSLGTSLCILVGCSVFTSVWELKNNGVENSWTKLFTIELTKHFREVNDFVPFKSLSNGKIVLGLRLNKIYLRIVLYDPKHDTVETLMTKETMIHFYKSFNILVFEESLHSLDTGTYLGQLQWEAFHEKDESDTKE